MRYRILVPLFVLFLGLPAAAETVTLEPSRDATLIESDDGGRANGSGPYFFAGHNAQAVNGIRRALLYFDVAGTVPRGAMIESASLRLFLEPSNPAPRELSLHLVLADWGEGPSSASGGGGAVARTGDATWLHTFYDTEFWVHRGGHFVARASASLEVSDSGYYTWEATPRLVRDVRLWHAAPRRNFGWILIGDESTLQNAKSFASRENPDPALRPVLEITYREK